MIVAVSWKADTRMMTQTGAADEQVRVVVLTGPPGSGKTELGGQLARALRIPFLARDDVRGGLFFTQGSWTGTPRHVPSSDEAVEALLRMIETMAGLGVSFIVEYVVRRGRPDDLQRISAVADCVVLQTACRDAPARFARRNRTDRLLNRQPVLEALGHATIDEHTAAAKSRMALVHGEMQTEFDIPTMQIATDHGYEPDIDRIIEFVVSDHATRERSRADGIPRRGPRRIARRLAVVCEPVPDTTTPQSGALPPPGPPGAAPSSVPTPAIIATDESPARRQPQPGQLTTAWRAMVVATWVGVFVAYLAMWKASEELGIATWWLGPRSSPQPLIVRLVPFVVAAVFGILASYNVPRMPLIGLIGAALLAAIAIPDLSRSAGLAAIEFAIAGAVALVSAASFTGMYRQAGSGDAG